MASTGYQPKTIQMEQPTSSGQTVALTTGCIAQFRTGSKLEQESGSSQIVESGGVVRDQNVALTTAAATLVTGLYLKTSTHVTTLPAPTLGKKVTVVCTKSTKAMKVSSGSTLYMINSTATPYTKVVALTFATTKAARIGHTLAFTGLSTIRWVMETAYPSTIKLSAFSMSSAT